MSTIPAPTNTNTFSTTMSNGVNWVTNGAKNAAASMGDLLGRIWATVCSVLSSIGSTLSQWGSSAYAALSAGLEQMKNLPTETKGLVGGLFVLAAGAGALAMKYWSAAAPAGLSSVPSSKDKA